MKTFRRIISLLLVAALLTAVVGCNKEVTAEDLMSGITQGNASEEDLDAAFRQKYCSFAFTLLNRQYAAKGGNAIVSPLAVSYNLSMLANGASSNNKINLNKVYGSFASTDSNNVKLHSYKEKLKDTDFAKLYFASAMWFNSDLNATPDRDFLTSVKTYYNTAAYRESFKGDAVKNINNYVSNSTNMNVEHLLSDIPADVPAYLVSTTFLDANWESPYSYDSVVDSTFNGASGEEKVQMMSSFENIYLENDFCTGFMKNYSGKNYAFVAILPKQEGDSALVNCLQQFSKETVFPQLIKTRSGYHVVDATVPKFTCENAGGMKDVLADMDLGLSFASDKNQLEQLGTCDGNMYFGDFYVRSVLSVTEKGTSKGTGVSSNNDTATGVKVVRLNRPFIFAVVDCKYNIPVMVGVLNSVNG